MSRQLTPKQEKFVLNLFSGMSQRESYIKAGYSDKTALASIDSKACELAKTGKIQGRLSELQAKAESEAILTKQEGLKILTEVARAKLTDFMELGADGSWVNIGPETPNGRAIQEIHSRTEYDKDGNAPTIYTSVKLYSPLDAVKEIAKQLGWYPSEKLDITSKGHELKGTTVIQVVSQTSKRLTERIMNGDLPSVEIPQIENKLKEYGMENNTSLREERASLS